MLNAIVRFSLQQRIILVVVALAAVVFGVQSLQSLSVDAFPDVTNVQVQIATEAPGRSPEEVERFITVPLEIAMTGLPGLTEMRSLNRNALSLITLVFRDDVNVFFARQLVMERIIEVALAPARQRDAHPRAGEHGPRRGVPVHAGEARRQRQGADRRS
jgi:heavy metal efflux system protein